MAAAAEKRRQEAESRGRKGEVRLPKSRDEMPDLPANNDSGLKWTVG